VEQEWVNQEIPTIDASATPAISLDSSQLVAGKKQGQHRKATDCCTRRIYFTF